YLKFHPGKGKTAKSHPKEFFKFAGNAVLSEIHEKKYKWSWDHFKTRRDQRLQYVECYVADKMKQATEEQTQALAQLERILSFEDIRFYRSLAKSKIRRERIRIDKENEKKKAENAKVGWWGWLSGASSTNKEGETSEDDDTDSIHMTEEQKKELYNAIEYVEDKASIASAVDVPKDTIRFALKTKLNRGSFTLKQNVKKPDETNLVSVVFDTVTVNVIQYMVDSMKIDAALGDLQLFDGATKDTMYPQLIGVKKKNNRQSSLLDVDNNLAEAERRLSDARIKLPKPQDPFFSVVFEKKPLSNKADNAISLKMRHLEIIYSPVVIAGIINFFKPPSSKMESVNALIVAAGDTFEDLKLQTRAGLEFALETHTTLELDVDMDAPIIIIPERQVVRFDAGHINVDSQLADKEVIHDIKSKDITKYNKQDIKTLEDLMYDKFNLQLSQTKVLIGSNTKECLWQLHGHPPRHGVDARFIERIDMDFLIELCILPGKTEFTKIKVSGQLPLLSVNLSDSKYKVLMKIIDFVIPKTEEGSTPKKPQFGPANSNVITERFWGSQNQDILLLDSDSDRASAHSQLASPTASQGGVSISASDVEQFKLNFQVDKVLALVHETSPQDPTQETLLCEVLLENFELAVVTRPDDLIVDVSLKALSVKDMTEHEGDFHHLVISGIIDRKQTVGHSGEKKLVNVRYIKASKQHPQFEELYERYDQTVDVALSTLTVVVTRKSILRIYNWIMNTFTGPPSSSSTSIETGKEVYEGDVFYDDYLNTEQQPSALDHQTQNKLKTAIIKPDTDVKTDNNNRMKVAIHMDSVNLILNNEGQRLGTVELRFGELLILLEPTTIEVNGKFGNFTLSDDTQILNQSSASVQGTTSLVPDTYIISIVGDELADFTYKTYDSNSSKFPGYNQKFVLHMGAIQILVTDSVKPTLNFLQEFLEMKTVYDAARNSAIETAQQYQEVSSRFHFDIKVKSPVVIFPVGDNKKTDALIAHLGEIRAKNKFSTVLQRDLSHIPNSVSVPMTQISFGLYDISLRSSTVVHNVSGESTKHVLPIIDDLNIVFHIQSPENPKESVCPDTQIEGNISDMVESILTDKKALTSSSRSHVSEETSDIVSIASLDAKITLDLVIKLNTVYLEVLTGKDEDIDNRDQHMLSRLAFNDISLKLQNMSNETMLMEVNMQSISFADTRAESKSKFKEILPANTLDGPQFQFKMWSFKHEGIPVIDMYITVDSPKIVLSLDYLFLLKDFFMSPFVQNQAPPTEMHFNVNVVDLQVLCLASPERESSEAVILSFNQLTVVQKKDLEVNLNGIRMVLCRMDNVEESTMHFVEEFSMTLGIVNAATGSVHNLTSITLHVQHIVLRLSYQDLMLITTITNKVMALMGASNNNTAPKPSITDNDASEIDVLPPNAVLEEETNNQNTPLSESSGHGALSVKPKGIEPFIVMSKESLTASFEGLQIILIEDLHDLPFVDVNVNPFTVNASDWSRAMMANVDFYLKANNFNFKNSHWEPIIEPWNLCIKVSQDSTD
ncbi:hypothetical protein CU098_002960, partial [Rhizopus stolonifer]